MFCQQCHQEYSEDKPGSCCPFCHPGKEAASQQAGSPTLIRGLGRPSLGSVPGGRRMDGKGVGLLPLIWVAAVLLVIPWLLSRPQPSTPIASAPVAPQQMMAAPPPVAAAPQAPVVEDSNEINLVIHLQPNHWMDTGIDMCGCAHVKVVASGAWQTPLLTTVGPDGSIYTNARASLRSVKADRLTHSAPYGALVGRVGSDPYTLLGSGKQVAGDQFNDSGTLKIGMNAGRTHGFGNPHGMLTVCITGSGALDHQPALCSVPR